MGIVLLYIKAVLCIWKISHKQIKNMKAEK